MTNTSTCMPTNKKDWISKNVNHEKDSPPSQGVSSGLQPHENETIELIMPYLFSKNAIQVEQKNPCKPVDYDLSYSYRFLTYIRIIMAFRISRCSNINSPYFYLSLFSFYYVGSFYLISYTVVIRASKLDSWTEA